MWCWKTILRVLWTARRPNQSILKEIRSGCSLEGLMLSWNSNILATWCEELTHLKRPWCSEKLRAGGEGNGRRWDGWVASPTQWTWVNSGSWWWTVSPGVLQFMGSQRVGHDWVTELNWTELNYSNQAIHHDLLILYVESTFWLSPMLHSCPLLLAITSLFSVSMNYFLFKNYF